MTQYQLFAPPLRKQDSAYAHNEIEWRGRRVRVSFDPAHFGGVTEHLVIRVLEGAPVKLTSTGYLSHFVPPGSIGNAEDYACAMLDIAEAKSAPRILKKSI